MLLLLLLGSKPWSEVGNRFMINFTGQNSQIALARMIHEPFGATAEKPESVALSLF